MRLQVVSLGCMDYMEAFELQNCLLKARQDGIIEDTLLLLEHPPVLTIGRSGSRTNILVAEDYLQKLKVGIYDVNRGGDITYHGPGQIVGYPIIDLGNIGRDVRTFVRNLEDVFIRLLLEEYGIEAGRDPINTGVWVGNEKITAIGLAVKKWVTQHGFAFNVNTDLSHFKWINPCGIIDKGVTSIQKLLGRPIDIGVVSNQVVSFFCDIYDYDAFTVENDKLMSMVGGEDNVKA